MGIKPGEEGRSSQTERNRFASVELVLNEKIKDSKRMEKKLEKDERIRDRRKK